MFAILFPNIDPALITIGQFNIRWYGIAYALGVLLALHMMYKLSIYRASKYNTHNNSEYITRYLAKLYKTQIDTMSLYVIVGIVLGGRLGYVLFYHPSWFIERPMHIMNTLEGGMSFHGGFIGVMVGLLVFCYRNHIQFLSIADLACCVAPIGLFFGRCANFINAELCGRVTSAPWAIIFPYSDGLPRHPSQLYEAFCEGILLFIILVTIFVKTSVSKKPGMMSGLFMLGYSVFRIILEEYREPDVNIGYFFYNIGSSKISVTFGQILTIPMFVIALALIIWAQQNFYKKSNKTL